MYDAKSLYSLLPNTLKRSETPYFVMVFRPMLWICMQMRAINYSLNYSLNGLRLRAVSSSLSGKEARKEQRQC